MVKVDLCSNRYFWLLRLQTVQIFHDQKLVTTHLRAEHEGQSRTQMDHYPAKLREYLLQPSSYCRSKAGEIGPSTTQVVNQLLSDRPMDRLRSVQGILKLEQTVGPVRLESACQRALYYGDLRYRCIKEILNKALDREPLPDAGADISLTEHAFARSASEFFPSEHAEEVI